MKQAAMILGLFLISSGISNAQGIRTVSLRTVVPVDLYCSCGEVEMGYASGDVELHFVMHFVKDIPDPVWMNIMGTKSTVIGVEGEIKGETFRVSELDKFNRSDLSDHIIDHSNMIGDKGHHFILKGYLDYENDRIFWEKAVCPGDE